MFKVSIKTSVKIEGCPSTGLPALDFRREHGLPERLDNIFPVEGAIDDESAFRTLVAAGYSVQYYSDGTGEIVAHDGSWCWPSRSPAKHGSSYGWRAQVPVDVLHSGSLLDILLAVAEDSSGERQKRRERQAELEAARAKVAELEAALAV